jgi:hypothetical protein
MHTFNEVRKYIENLEYELLSDKYLGCHNKLIIKDKFGYIYTQTFSNFKICEIPQKFSTNNPYTIDNIKIYLKLNNKPFELVSDKYNGCKSLLILKDINNYFYVASINQLQGDTNLHKFHTSNPYTIQNIKLWCELNNKSFELISKKYNGNDKNLKWKCLKKDCGEIFHNSLGIILKGCGCTYCSNHKLGLSNCLAIKNPELAKEWHPINNGNLTPYDILCGGAKYFWWKCKDCGFEWEARIGHRNKGCGCPECNKSKGEKRIKEIFDLKEIYYIPQKEFIGLIGLGNGNLSYDFYLPQYNLLIEYQGKQHQEYIKGFFKTKKDFEKQLEHDRRKKEYANKNNIILLEIWYYDFDKIEEILESELNSVI